MTIAEIKAFVAIFDNGGGITLQLPEWAHYYEAGREAQAANDLREYLTGDGDTSGWDGHDEDAMDLNPTDDEIRNGGYRVATDVESLEALREWGHNTSALWSAFRA